METNLIIIEGIPGSGKTTTAKKVHAWATSHGLNTTLHLEDSSSHPVDLDNLAYFDYPAYQNLLATFSEYRKIIERISRKGSKGYFVYYRQLDETDAGRLPAELLETVFQHDAHDSLPAEKYRSLLVERWKRFGDQKSGRDGITILECCFLQNPLTYFVGKHNYKIDQVNSVLHDLAGSVQRLRPVLVFLHGESVSNTIQRVIGERTPVWLETVEKYITQQGYGAAHNLQGLEGVFQFYELLQSTQEAFISNLGWQKLLLDQTARQWNQHNLDLEQFLAGLLQN